MQSNIKRTITKIFYKYFTKHIWNFNYYRLRLGSLLPIEIYKLNAVKNNICGNCNNVDVFTKIFYLSGNDDHLGNFYICKICHIIYDASNETYSSDAYDIQTQWKEADVLYSLPTTANWDTEIESNRETYQFLENKLNLSFFGTLLEIGAGSGMRAAAGEPYFEKIMVYDHVNVRLKQLKESRQIDKIEVLNSSQLVDARADFVFLWHVLEHLVRPGNTIHFCSKLLNRGGYLIFQIPLLHKPWIEPKHYYFHNEESIKYSATIAELTVVDFIYDHRNSFLTTVLKKR